MHPLLVCLLTLGGFILFAWLIFILADRRDDAACGIALGQISPLEDALGHQPAGHTPELTRVRCFVCQRIRCSDKDWRVAREVLRPEDCGFAVQTSDGYCPPCLKVQMDNLTAGHTGSPCHHHGVDEGCPELRPA